MADTVSQEDLAARLAKLEKENEELKKASTAPARPHNGWRAVVSALLIIIGTVLVPAGIVSSWVRAELTNENRFVSTFAPLAEDPAIQAAVSDEVVKLIEEEVDFKELTNSVFDGIETLGLNDEAKSALNMLRAPATQGVESLVQSSVSAFVSSKAFAVTWEQALRYSHKAFVATIVKDSSDNAIFIDKDGTITIQLKPIVDEIKTYLVDQGLTFANNIPDVNTTITVAQSDYLSTITIAYKSANTLGGWLPVIAILIFALGIFVARHRLVALTGTGIGIAVGAAAVLIGILIGGPLLSVQGQGIEIPTDALTAAYHLITSQLAKVSWVILLIGVLLALLAASMGPSDTASKLRERINDSNDRVHDSISDRGWADNGFTQWLHKFRGVIYALIGILVLVLLYLLPTNFWTLILVVLGGLLLWWLVAVFADRNIIEPSRMIEDGSKKDEDHKSGPDSDAAPEIEAGV